MINNYYFNSTEMEAFIGEFEKLTDAQLQQNYYKLRDELLEITKEVMKTYPLDTSHEQMARGEKMGVIGSKIEAISQIVKSREQV